MKYIQIDIVIIGSLLGALSLYCMPEYFLLSWLDWGYFLIGSALFLIYAVCCRKSHLIQWGFRFLLLIIIIAYMQNKALTLLSEAKQIAALPNKIQAVFKIQEIHHQQDYQSAIIRVNLSPTLQNQLLYARLSIAEKVQVGEIWQGDLTLRAISSRLNQGGFDRQQWYFAKGITGYASIKSAVKIGEDFSWREKWLYQAKNQTADLSQQGLLLALGFGERAWLKNTDWKTYQQTNTAHLIAISGLHIGLAALIGFYLARGIQFFLPLKWISPYFPLLFSFLSALFYAQLAGFAIPTFRASIALFIMLAMRYYRYYFAPWRLFFLVVGFLLLADPVMVLSASFILSVGAVGSLILWYQVFPLADFSWQSYMKSRGLNRLFGLIHLQIGLFWLFMPLQLAMFNGFSAYGFIANLIAVPVFSFVLVPLVLFSILTQGSFWSWQIADWLAQNLLFILTLFEQGWIYIDKSMQWSLTGITAAILWWRLWKSKETKKYPQGIYWITAALICYAIVNLIIKPLKTEEWRIETLDVGQGLATLIVKNGRAVLYDTGAGWQTGSMAQLEILPYLRREGIVLDKLILSHDDNDHSGGAKDILSAFPHIEFISPSYQNYGKSDRTYCQAGLNFEWQGLSFRVLSPHQISHNAENSDSCVIKVSDGQYHLLLTGDADLATERKIMPNLGKIHILQVGHHGSKTSTGQALLNKIQPDIALISSGRWNPWHFPNKDVVKRLETAQSAVYNTAVSGQISVIIEQGKIKTETARERWKPWYSQLIVIK